MKNHLIALEKLPIREVTLGFDCQACYHFYIVTK